jgi:hypothetical protein
VARERFVDQGRSPVLTRALYIPKLSRQKNHFADYLLLQRVQDARGEP